MYPQYGELKSVRLNIFLNLRAAKYLPNLILKVKNI